jgi:hypothetical protein
MSSDKVRIKLKSNTVTTAGFRYGHYSNDNRSYLLENDGKEFDAIRWNMNYYQLPNGCTVHIYECDELYKL